MGTKYDREFKAQLVRQHEEQKRSVAELSEAYGIGDGTIYKWIKAYREDSAQAYPGSGHQKPDEEEVRKLRRKVMDLEEEVQILKKAAAYFAKQHG